MSKRGISKREMGVRLDCMAGKLAGPYICEKAFSVLEGRG